MATGSGVSPFYRVGFWLLVAAAGCMMGTCMYNNISDEARRKQLLDLEEQKLKASLSPLPTPKMVVEPKLRIPSTVDDDTFPLTYEEFRSKFDADMSSQSQFQDLTLRNFHSEYLSLGKHLFSVEVGSDAFVTGTFAMPGRRLSEVSFTVHTSADVRQNQRAYVLMTELVRLVDPKADASSVLTQLHLAGNALDYSGGDDYTYQLHGVKYTVQHKNEIPTRSTNLTAEKVRAE